MQIFRVLRVSAPVAGADSHAAAGLRANRLVATLDAGRNTIAFTTRVLTIAALSLAAIGGLGACNVRTVASQAPALAHHMTPFDNFGEILTPKKK